MSLYGALRSGVSGLFANAQRMGMIADNIANVNTTGYKRVDARFSTFVTSALGATGAYASGGVININTREAGAQGSIEPTSVATDLAISGNGYFIVAKDVTRNADGEFVPSGETVFTRSGEFRVDNNGNLRNSEGYFLLAWPRNDENTDFEESNEYSSMRAVNVGNSSFDPTATTDFRLGANLIPTTEPGAANAFTITQEVVDPQGRPRTMEFTFERAPSVEHTVYLTDGTNILDKTVAVSAPNTWRVFAKITGASIQTYNENGTNSGLVNDEIGVPIADMVFDSNGRLSALTAPGAATQYYRTSLPLSFTRLDTGVTVNEAGSSTASRYDLSNTLITDAVRGNVRDILVGSGVPAGGFSTPPTAAEIRGGIDTLDTEEYPLAMQQIMEILNGASAFSVPFRFNAGLPGVGQGVADMYAHDITGTNPVNNDPAGAIGSGLGPNTPQYLGARLVSSDGTLRNATTTIAGTDYTRLQTFTSSGNDKLRLTVDYDNSSSTAADRTDIDINIGTLTLGVFDGDSLLNRDNTRISSVGAGLLGNDGITQYHDELSTLRFVEQNGRRFSALQSVNIQEDGVVEGFYDNGETRQLFKVPLVTFANPNGLRATSGNIFEGTNASGIALTRVAGTSGAGRILSSAREGAAVDLAEEFSNMIVTQRAYSASTKIITTTDSMLEELTRSVR